MNLHRIYAVLLKNFYFIKHSLDRKTELFYWPSIDLILWGITSMYFKQVSPENGQIVVSIVMGIILWYVLWQGQAEINFSFLSELWYRNLVNMFTTPLKFSEFIASFMIGGIVKALITFSFTSIIAYLLYSVGAFSIGLWLIPFSAILMMMGWAYAFFNTGLNMRYGAKVQSISWTLVFMLSPFSGVFYPVSLLPEVAQRISSVLPTSYIFESMRSIINTGSFDQFNLVIALLLVIFYLCVGLIWLNKSFNYALEQGLVKLL